MKSRDELINELAELCGIVPEYWDIFGKKHVTSLSTKESILRSMRLKIDSSQEILDNINNIHDSAWLSFIEPVKVLSVNNLPFRIPIFVPLSEGQEGSLSVYWSIENEDGLKNEFTYYLDSLHIADHRWLGEQRYVKIEIFDRAFRDIGYYSLYVKCSSNRGELTGTSRIIITPDTCYIPPKILDYNQKFWGISINLYSINSKRNWGCGDFTDLLEMSKWLGDIGGHFVAINPMHALLNKMPYDISPYSPISRLYKNFIYLDLDNISDVSESTEAQVLMQSEPFKNELERLRQAELIDYESIAALKEKILRYAFETFYENHYKKTTKRGRIFKTYLKQEGLSLQSFSAYLAHYKSYGNSDWNLWQIENSNISDNKAVRLNQEYKKEILFYSYIQWLIDSQLSNIAESINSKLELGLMFDLAIGSIKCGSDVWNYQDIFALGINVGAPPDDFNPLGQDWGFPPLIPQMLKKTGYEFFIQTIRKTMKYAKALRIDHALGMFRLFWIPEGSLPSDGAYVVNPSEDLLRIIALESTRNKTMIIAEDLGTVGENVFDRLQNLNMLSYKLLYFERNYPDPSFKAPNAYPQKALCAVTTHDLATCSGFWISHDIKIKKELGLYTDDEKYQRHLSERQRDKKLLLNALVEHGILHGENSLENLISTGMSEELCIAIYEYLAKTPCMLASVSLDDILGTINQQNLPGIIETYPCWRQKTALDLEKIITEERFKKLAEIFSKNGR